MGSVWNVMVPGESTFHLEPVTITLLPPVVFSPTLLIIRSTHLPAARESRPSVLSPEGLPHQRYLVAATSDPPPTLPPSPI